MYRSIDINSSTFPNEVVNVTWVNARNTPDSKVQGANMGPIWDRQDPDGPHVGPWTLLSGIVYYIHAHRNRRGFSTQDIVAITYIELMKSNAPHQYIDVFFWM